MYKKDIYYSTDGITFTYLDEVNINATSYTYTGVDATEYWFKIRF